MRSTPLLFAAVAGPFFGSGWLGASGRIEHVEWSVRRRPGLRSVFLLEKLRHCALGGRLSVLYGHGERFCVPIAAK